MAKKPVNPALEELIMTAVVGAQGHLENLGFLTRRWHPGANRVLLAHEIIGLLHAVLTALEQQRYAEESVDIPG